MPLPTGAAWQRYCVPVPLMRDLGIACDWKIITGDKDFFSVTKTMHNALQGAKRSITDHEKEIYLTYSTRNAHLLEEEYDLIVAHDPQPLACPYFHGRGGTRWIWRSHIDTSEPNPELWAFLRPYLQDYDAAVFTLGEFVPPEFPVPRWRSSASHRSGEPEEHRTLFEDCAAGFWAGSGSNSTSRSSRRSRASTRGRTSQAS